MRERYIDRVRVLVVDDERDLRETLAEVLEGEGHTVEVAVHGAQALERVRASRPDLILLDLMMPVMNGYEFLDAKRRESNAADVPVIVVTAQHEARVQDVCEVVYKPFRIEQLLAAAARCAARRKGGSPQVA